MSKKHQILFIIRTGNKKGSRGSNPVCGLFFVYNAGEQHPYTYNGDGQRIGKYKDGVKTRYYHYDEGNRVINEIADNYNISVIYGHLPLGRVVNGTLYYYFYNFHGDVIKLMNENGDELNGYRYDTWGNFLYKAEAVKNDLTYFGQIYDDESGNYYLSSRYYNPETKRFISRDSYEGQLTEPLSLNQYAYCHNNPLTYVNSICTRYKKGK